MKIAFILPGSGPAGGVRSTVNAANLLLRRGHEVRVFSLRRTFQRRIKMGLKNLLVKGNCDWLDHFQGEKHLYREISEIPFQTGEIIVAVSMLCSAQLGRLALRDNPKLQFIRGLTPWMPEVEKEALLLPFPKVVIASHMAAAVKACNPACKCTVIPNGIDLGEYYPCLPESSRDGVGTIYGAGLSKDPETILNVLGSLRKDMPGVHQYIFGIPKRPRAIPDSNYCRCPSVEQARKFYSMSKVWIMTSRSEGFSLPILEAMACGCAVVATDCGGPRDIIKDGENGFLVKVGDIDRIVDRVKTLLGDEVLRQQFVRRSDETVRHYSWETSVDKLERVLQTICAT